ncbi:hypothetical protein Golax_022102 [Gossypium laxum]|uniref:Phosphatidylinositol 4-phosphate 5-kinase n=1 Tax=Gossypium laxum TaxID=34288 RepID=A0A7J9AN56_9ROSI|nr:hypothetical protein [Gossypium laxum]
MSVAHVDDEEAAEVGDVEKALPSGDFYTGQWCNGCPHGNGKYLWTDGCMYVGEWFKGKTTGKGKFCWPSGATYEGEFKHGFMDGKGTYTGFSGETYKGTWVMNLKQGEGTISFVNGDYYEGEWRRGFQEGYGRYHWKNGNQYIGQWKKGLINGNGTMIWSNGNRYDGFWEDGFPKGNGTYKWPDGSFFVGIWSKDGKDQNGTYYPSDSPTEKFDWDPQQVFLEDLKDCKICGGEKVSIWPSEKMPHWFAISKEKDGKQRRRSDGSLSGFSMSSDFNGGSVSFGSEGITRHGDGSVGRLHLEDSVARGSSLQLKKPPTRRQGQTISRGHKNFELMLNLQLGIRLCLSILQRRLNSFPVLRHSVGRPGPALSLDLKTSAFDPREKFWTRFPPEGSKHTPPHPSSEFKWKDYCPLVFRTLRKLFDIDAADYMLSICGDDALRELSSPGKSGSFFYLTNDDKYMIKTMKKAEVKVLIRMLPAYYNHVRSFKDTLVTKFFGLHCVKLTGSTQKKVRFVVMGNLFCTDTAIHRRFDLKGSFQGRTTAKPEAEIDSTTTLKDLDLNYIFRLQKLWFKEFCSQVDRDCDFLENERIMDYSLLIGLHFREVSTPHTSGVSSPTGLFLEMEIVKMEKLLGYLKIAMISLLSTPHDILQDYDISKKLEHAYKSMQYDPTSISAVDPKLYSKRFRDFIFKVFIEDT